MMNAFSRLLFCNISGTPEVLGQCEVSHGIMPILQYLSIQIYSAFCLLALYSLHLSLKSSYSIVEEVLRILRGLGGVVGLTLPMARAARGSRPVYYLTSYSISYYLTSYSTRLVSHKSAGAI